jgi:outer membrane protein assembly factor BamB
MENDAHDEHFTPEDVDEQIARYLQAPNMSDVPGEKMIHDLEALYHEDERILERAWQRLNDAAEIEMQKQTMPSSAQHNERTVQPMIMHTQLGEKTYTSHRFSALVAGLVAVVILGTLATAFAIGHVKGLGPGLNNTQTATTVVTPEGVYAGGAGYVERLDQSSGHVLWKTTLASNPKQATTGAVVTNTLGIAQGVVYVTTLSNSVEAINANNGKVIWSHFYAHGAKDGIYINPNKSNNAGVNNTTRPIVSEGIVYIATQDGITGLSTKDGSIQHILGGMNPEYTIVSNILYGSSYTQVGNYSTFYAITASTGKILWQKQISNVTFAKPQFANGAVYVPSYHTMIASGDFLYAFRASDGAQLLKIGGAEGTEYVSITVAAGKIFVNELGGQMLAFDAKTGARVWVQNIGWVGPGFPQVIGNTVYTITDNDPAYGTEGAAVGPMYGRLLFALDIHSGSGIWEYGNKNGTFDVSGVITGKNSVYMVRMDGQITALTPNRNVLWNSAVAKGANFMTVAVAD